MSNITTNVSFGVVLTTASFTNPVSIVSGVTVANYDIAVDGQAVSWTIENSGVVQSAPGDLPGSIHIGVDLEAGGEFSNTTTGTVTSWGVGVYVAGGSGVIVNQGVIAAQGEGSTLTVGAEIAAGVTSLILDNEASGVITGATGVSVADAGATIINAGYFYGYGSRGNYAGLQLSQTASGAVVTNETGGTISGSEDGIAVYAADVTITSQDDATIAGYNPGIYLGGADDILNNDGLVAGSYAVGVDAESPAIDVIITNGLDGTITGGYGGIYIDAAGGAIVNQGLVRGTYSGTGNTAYGILAGTDASGLAITNESTGTIAGASGMGIGIQASDVTVVNQGLISGFQSGIAAYGNGASGISIEIEAGGTISGNLGISLESSASTVNNDGLISGTGSGISVGDTAPIDPLGKTAGGTMIGLQKITSYAGDATIVNSGQVTGLGSTRDTAGIYAGSAATSLVVINEVGGTISGYDGVFSKAGGMTITNDGVISATGTTYYSGGIYTSTSAGSGLVVNNEAGATISGYHGIYVGLGDASITNDGVIMGTGTYDYAAGVYQAYAGSLSLTNEVGATISGYYGIYLEGGPDTVTNFGVISSSPSYGQGVHVGSYVTDMSLTNEVGGTISGYNDAVDIQAPGAIIGNAGLITGGSAGVSAASYATGLQLTNLAGGTISGGSYAIYLQGAGDTVMNQGDIAGGLSADSGGIEVEADGTAVNVTNDVGATISGWYGAALFAPDATIDNDGVIAGGSIDGGFGIYVGAYAVDTQIINGADATISGRTGIAMYGAGEGASFTLLNHGEIVGYSGQAIYAGTDSTGFVVTNEADGTIAGQFYVAGGTGDVITNSGLIGGNGEIPGILEVSTAGGILVTNLAGGTISGHTAIYLDGNGTIDNSGVISGGGRAAILATTSATTLQITNEAGAVIEGTGGIASDGALLLVNSGAILGGSGEGVSLYSGGLIGNEASGMISGTTGVDLDNVSGELVNYGTITGTAGYGVFSDAAGSSVLNLAGGVISGSVDGVFLANGTLTNAGTIVGTDGTAVSFANFYGPSLLIVDPGAVFVGAVDGGTYGSAIELGSAASEGTIDGLGVSFTNFSGLAVDEGAQWELVDAYGTLSSGLSNGGALAFDNSTLTLASITGAGTIDLEDDGKLYVQGTVSAGETVTFDSPTGTALLSVEGADMAGTLANFGPGDVLDLRDLGFVSGSTSATVSGNVLTVTDGSLTETFATSGLADGTLILSQDDDGDGTYLMLATPPAPSDLVLAPASDSGVLGDDYTSDTTPTITGAGVTGDTVVLYEGTSALGTATVVDGTWSIDASTLSPGVHTLTAIQTSPTDVASPTSDALVLTIDTTPPPPAPTLALSAASDSGVAGDGITNVTTPSIIGTGVAGETVTLYDGSSIVGTGTVAGDGTWSIVTQPLADGPHVLTALEAARPQNPSGVSSAVTLTIDTAIPLLPSMPTLAVDSDSGVLGDQTTDQAAPVLTGTGVAGDIITLAEDQLVVGTATVSDDGTWSAATSALAVGLHQISATQTDVAGNVSAASDPLALTIVPMPTAPTLTDPSADTTAAKPVIVGAAPASSTVSLYEGSVLVGTASATPSGSWAFTFTTALSVGDHVLTATATDAYGDVSGSSAPVHVQVSDSGGYTFVSPPDDAGDTISRIHDSTGSLVEVDTRNAVQQLLQSVSNTQAILEIYDDQGRLIGTITQPSTAATSQPVFLTAGQTLSATTGSGPVGSVVNLIMESNIIHSQGNDTVNAGPGNDTIYAAGASCSIVGGSGTLVYIGGQGSTTVTGGAGSSTVFGGAGGSEIHGGSAGRNVLVGGGGSATVLGGGDGDTLVGGSGTTLLAMDQGGVAFGGTGTSTVFGASGGNLVAGSGDGTLIAGAGNESLWGGTGNATLFGGVGSDTLASGSGNNTLVAGSGTTVFIDGGGASTMWGGAGDTTVFGGGGATQAHLGAGNGTVLFGQGSMSVTGGTGLDLYAVVRDASTGGHEDITGFKVGTDQLDLFGYTQAEMQQTFSGGNTIFSLNDGTTVTLIGVAALAPNSVAFG